MSYKPTIVVDFDGTAVEHDFPNVGKPKDGVVEALGELRSLGFHILISSCRNCTFHRDDFPEGHITPTERKGFKAMQEALDRYGIPYDEIDDGSRGKPLGALYVDDNGFRFDNNWPAVVEFVKARM